MARIVKRVDRHNCYEEVKAAEEPDLWYGSVIECSCGSRFVKSEGQLDGAYWAQVPDIHGRPEPAGADSGPWSCSA